MTDTKQTAIDAFLSSLTEVEDLLSVLSEHAENHFDVHPDNVHWGHVGTVDLVRDQLKQIVYHLGI